MAKKMKLVGLAVTLTAIVASVGLASCNKSADKSASSTSTATHQTQMDMNMDKSVFVAPFNPTENFIKHYTDKSYDFNANLPLRLGFTQLLNTLSNASDVLAIENSEKQKLGELQVLQQLQTQFTATVAKYKAMDPMEVKSMFEKAGIVVNLDTANLTTLLGQLSTSCAQNNNYQVDTNKLVKSLVIKDKDGKVVAFPEAEMKMLTSWSEHFMKACQLNDQLYQIASVKGFEYNQLPMKIAEIQKAITADITPTVDDTATDVTKTANDVKSVDDQSTKK